MLTEPWAEDAEAVAVALGGDAPAGISAVEAARRLDRFGANRLDVRTTGPSVAEAARAVHRGTDHHHSERSPIPDP